MKERENEERRDACVSDNIELKFQEMEYKEIVNIQKNTSDGDNGEKKVASIKIDKIKSGMTENNEVRVEILTSTGNKDEVDSDASTSETGLIQPISGSINMLAAVEERCEESVASDVSTCFKDDEDDICPSSDDDDSNESFEIEDDEMVISDNSAEDIMIDTSQSNESTGNDEELTVNIKEDKIEKHCLQANNISISSNNDEVDICPSSNDDDLNESFEIEDDEMVIPDNSAEDKKIDICQSIESKYF
ncbi:dentin sialophosphoprotein-like [Hydractinia symbiolongicarpus]|uniref:dentin sialophosphoprotein-like n=1 Tax=Hydractinia symbiolongicarpus TaxID=13093 RepID=UPI0025503770|nr:dentin sialophosphoprotein-like [Hydractinia symbiolongicarpus]